MPVHPRVAEDKVHASLKTLFKTLLKTLLTAFLKARLASLMAGFGQLSFHLFLFQLPFFPPLVLFFQYLRDRIEHHSYNHLRR